MARSKRKAGKAAKAGANPATARCEIERLIEKHRFKDALKQAKVYFRQDGSHENRLLLERAYLLRTQDLSRGQMPAAAAEVAERLLEFGVTDSSVAEGLALLLPQIGLAARAVALGERLEAPEAQARLTFKLADRAVLHPEESLAARPALREGALQICAALAALDAGDETLAQERLQTVPRSSPFADWRYFVRGWAAFRRGDFEQAAANWDRLDLSRCAHSIAERVRKLAPTAQGPAEKTDLSLLEVAVFGEAILGRLERLRRAVAEGRWSEVVKLLGPLRLSLRKIEPALAERLTRVLLEPLSHAAMELSYERARQLIANFAATAEPLSFDPHWNRFWAVLWEAADSDLEGEIDHWRQYIDDLEQLAALSPEDRRRRQAIVWRRMAQTVAKAASRRSSFAIEEKEYEDDELDRAGSQERKRAVDYLDRSIQLDPSQRASHALALGWLEEWDQPEQAAAVASRLLEVFPDDIEALDYIIGRHLNGAEPEAALPYIKRARALKPLDDSYVQNEREARLLLARLRAAAGRWDEGRSEFERAAQLEPPLHDLLPRRAAFEFKAGQTARAEEHIQDALRLGVEPAVLWLALAIQAYFYELPDSTHQRFEAALRAELRKKVRSEAAGGLAALLGGFLASDIKYPGREEHISQVADYLRKSTRTKYKAEDLDKVCTFLYDLDDEQALFEKLARRGVKSFPDSPYFLCAGAAMEVQKGPFKCNIPKARKLLEQALAAVQNTNIPNAAKQAAEIQQNLSLLKNFEAAAHAMPFAGRGRRGQAGIFDFITAMIESEFESDEPDHPADDFDDDRPLFDQFEPRRERPNKRNSK